MSSIEGEGLRVGRYRLVESFEFREKIPAIIISFAVRPEGERLVVARERLFRPAEFLERETAIVIGLGIIGLQRDRLLATGARLFETPELLERDRQVRMARRNMRIDRNGLREKLCGTRVITLLAGYGAEQAQSAEMIRGAAKDLPIDLLGISEPALLMERECALHLRLKVEGRDLPISL